MKFEIIKNQLFKNTIILLITNLIIRGLGLINRLILVRSLGENAISLYTLILPTIMLFLSISCFSLNTSMIKVTAVYKTKKAIKTGINIAVVTSSISSLILLLILKLLSNNLLNQPSTYYPILASIPLFYVTSISTVLRGYLTGIEKISITSIANLLEQITRILFILIIFLLIKKQSDMIYVLLCVIAMTVGEIFSIIFTILNIKKQKDIKNINNIDYNEQKIKKELLDISIPSTLNSLSSNLTFFLEPIIFTFALKQLNVNSNDILFKYSEVSTFALPLISLFSFISVSISTALMPKLSTSNNKEIAKKIPKVILLCLLPAILVSSVLFHYSDKISLLLYNTTTGSNLVTKYVWLFIPSYLIYPFNTILVTKNKSKQVFVISLIVHIIKLISILLLPFISHDSLIISYIIAIYITFIIQFTMLYKEYKFIIKFNKVISLLLITIIINICSLIFKQFNINYLIQIFMIFTCYLFLILFVYRNNK